MRSLMSRLRLLTLFASQRQRKPSWLPVLSAKPVMLAKVIGTAPKGAEGSAGRPSLSPVVCRAFLFGRRGRQLGRGRIQHRHIGVPDPAGCLDLPAFRQALLLAFKGAIGRDILRLAFDGGGEDMPAMARRHEIKVV